MIWYDFRKMAHFSIEYFAKIQPHVFGGFFAMYNFSYLVLLQKVELNGFRYISLGCEEIFVIHDLY